MSTSPSIYSLEQQKILFWITKFPAAFSIACSSIVIYHLWLDKKHRLKKVYGRLWLFLSLSNMLVSFMTIIAGLGTPKDTGLYGAFGNETSCTAMGASFMFFFVICMGYNASLAVFYFISIHLTKWTERDFVKRVEPWLHIVPFVYAVAGVTVGITSKMFSTHDIFMYCWAAPSPFGCRYDGNEGASCQHGNTLRDAFVFLGGLVELNLMTSTKVISMFALYRTVLKQEKKMQARYHAKVSRNSIAKETFIQSFLHWLACAVPYALMIMLRIIDLYGWQEEIVKTPSFFRFSVIAQFLFPTQGVINMICYFRPKVKERQRQVSGDESIFHSLLVLIEIRKPGRKPLNRFAAPGGTYGGGSSRTISHNASTISASTMSDVERAKDDSDDNGGSHEIDMFSSENMDCIGYMDVTELEKATGHSFFPGEEMVGDIKRQISVISQPKQPLSGENHSQPSSTDNKRIAMTGEVIQEQAITEHVGVESNES